VLLIAKINNGPDAMLLLTPKNPAGSPAPQAVRQLGGGTPCHGDGCMEPSTRLHAPVARTGAASWPAARVDFDRMVDATRTAAFDASRQGGSSKGLSQCPLN